MYIACMHISPIHITISFLPAELQRRDALTPNDITGAGHALFVQMPVRMACKHVAGVGFSLQQADTWAFFALNAPYL